MNLKLETSEADMRRALGHSLALSSLLTKVMGGVRHQMKDIADGCAVRLTVEFPALLPNPRIREHQLRLACEFSHWFDALLIEISDDQSSLSFTSPTPASQ